MDLQHAYLDWNIEEVKIIVKDYFQMLQMEIGNKKYNKTYHRRILSPLLKNRSKGSIEFKHQNISAVLVRMGLPFIKGYKPRSNYQQVLEDAVSEYLYLNRSFLENQFEIFAESHNNFQSPIQGNFQNIVTDGPITKEIIEAEPSFRPIKINYLEKEQNNRILGAKGEELVLEYEKWRLRNIGKLNLADKVEWVSKDLGDGTGFDILSKNTNGTDRFIEVKTTKLSKETPIYLTKNEIAFAIIKKNEFFLYRVFNFDSNPRFFIKNGRYDTYCNLQAESFKAFF